jgi:hypothetical protein
VHLTAQNLNLGLPINGHAQLEDEFYRQASSSKNRLSCMDGMQDSSIRALIMTYIE